MLTEVIMDAVVSLRETIYNEIKEQLRYSPDHVVETHIDLPGDIDEDRYHTATITSVYLDSKDNVKVAVYDDLYGDEGEDDLMCYSLDEMLKIAEAV